MIYPQNDTLYSEKKTFFQKYVNPNAPLVRVPSGRVPGFVYLSENFELETAQGGWRRIEGQVLLQQGTDTVFTTHYWDTPRYEGLPLPINMAMEHRRGKLSTLADTRYRCDGMVFTQKELVAFSGRLRSEVMGVLYPVDGRPDFFSLHEAGDTYMDWREVFVWDVVAIATQSEANSITKTLYRTSHRSSPEFMVDYLVGYQAPQGPEFLVFMSAVGLVNEWPTEELLQVLSRREVIMAGLHAIAPPKKQSFFSRLGFFSRPAID